MIIMITMMIIMISIMIVIIALSDESLSPAFFSHHLAPEQQPVSSHNPHHCCHCHCHCHHHCNLVIVIKVTIAVIVIVANSVIKMILIKYQHHHDQLQLFVRCLKLRGGLFPTQIKIPLDSFHSLIFQLQEYWLAFFKEKGLSAF